MSNIFLASDQHFGHSAMVDRFKRADGSPLRNFASIEEHDETLIDNWNRVVKPEDRVYSLGDTCMSHTHLHKVGRLNGRKVLIQGNHDPIGGKKGKKFPFHDYFEYVTAAKVLDDMILTHIPVHPTQIGRFGQNVHGHLHANQVMLEPHNTKLDVRYTCVSMEQINYTPISLEDLRVRIKERQQAAGYRPGAMPYGNGPGPS
jgi:calcineurin-like phosphoesterase family protein